MICFCKPAQWLRTQVIRWQTHWQRYSSGFPQQDNTQITSSLFVGGQYRLSQIDKFEQWGVTGVISMRSRYPQGLNPKKVEFLHLPTTDSRAPSQASLQTGVEFAQKHISSGGKVYVHCRMGEGRGPTMAAAYLISQGCSLDQALVQLTKKRPFVRVTRVQKKSLNQFASDL
ncbi:MAG: protein phosphatase [Candidatus Pacebacteria bacterium]|nr:protein phosphatase [Candidatus Paceibacterota bacterium]